MKKKNILGLMAAGALALTPYIVKAANAINWNVSGTIGGSDMWTSHNSAGQEGFDFGDSTWAQAPGNPNNQWLQIGINSWNYLQTDNRPNSSTTPFNFDARLVSSDANAYNSTVSFGWNFSQGNPAVDGGYFQGTILGAYTASGQDINFSGHINAANGSLGSYNIQNVHDGDVFMTGTYSPGVVPEPSTIGLLGAGAGVAGLSRLIRRRKDKKSLESSI